MGWWRRWRRIIFKKNICWIEFNIKYIRRSKPRERFVLYFFTFPYFFYFVYKKLYSCYQSAASFILPVYCFRIKRPLLCKQLFFELCRLQKAPTSESKWFFISSYLYICFILTTCFCFLTIFLKFLFYFSLWVYLLTIISLFFRKNKMVKIYKSDLSLTIST